MKASTLGVFVVAAFLIALLMGLLSPRLFLPLLTGVILGVVVLVLVSVMPSSRRRDAAVVAAVAIVLVVMASTVLGVAPWVRPAATQVLLDLGRDPAEVAVVEERIGRYDLPPAPDAVQREFGTDLPMGCAGQVCRRAGERPFILEVPYRAIVTVDQSAERWGIAEEYLLDDEAIADLAHLLQVYQKEEAPSAEPEPIADYVARSLGESWSFDRIEEEGPVIVHERSDPLPPMGSWGYAAGIGLTSPAVTLNTVRAVFLEHEDKSPVVLQLPRFLVLHSFPVAKGASLPGSDREEWRLYMPEDAREVGLILAPDWARNTVLTHVAGLHVDNLVAALVAMVGAAFTALFKDRLAALLKGAWGWLRGRLPARAAPRPDA